MASTQVVSLLQWLALLGIIAALLAGALRWVRWVRLCRRELAVGIRQVKRTLNAFADELARMRAAAGRFSSGDPEPLAAPAADLHALLAEASADYRARCAAFDTFLHAQQRERRLPAALLAWWPPHLRRQLAEAERLAAGAALLERHRRPFAAITDRIAAMPAQVSRRKARLVLLYNDIARSARQLQAAQVQLNGDRAIAATMRDARAALQALPAIEPDAFAAADATLAQNRAAVGATWAQLNTLEPQLRACAATIGEWRALHNALLANLDAITSTLGAILQEFSELSQVRPYPIAWSTSSEELTALYGARNTCGGRMDPRDRSRLTRDLARSREVLAQCNALLEQLATIRAGREAFVAFCREHGSLLVLPALWPQRVAPLSAAIVRFPEAWWPEADRVAALVPDAQALHDQQLQLIPEELETPIDERAVGDSLDEARAFVAACERFQARFARIEQRLIELQAAESHNQAALIEVIRHNDGALAQIDDGMQALIRVRKYPIRWSIASPQLAALQQAHLAIGDWDLARSPAQLEADLHAAQRLRDEIVQLLDHVRAVESAHDAVIALVLDRSKELQSEPLWKLRAQHLRDGAKDRLSDEDLSALGINALAEEADQVAARQIALRSALVRDWIDEAELQPFLEDLQRFFVDRERVQSRLQRVADQLGRERKREQVERDELAQLLQQQHVSRMVIAHRMHALAQAETAAIDWQSSEQQRKAIFAVKMLTQAEFAQLPPHHVRAHRIAVYQHVQELEELLHEVNRVAAARDDMLQHVQALTGKESDFPDRERFQAVWTNFQRRDGAHGGAALDSVNLDLEYKALERERHVIIDQVCYSRIAEDQVMVLLGTVEQLIVRCTRFMQRFRRIDQGITNLQD